MDNLPTLNIANAGSTIPVKFGLGGDRGLGVIMATWPKALPLACPAAGPTDVIEITTTSTSGLTYSPTTQQYQYNWKTPKTFAGKCYVLEIKLVDGTTRSTHFKFK